ncbi:unnamed protein product [Trifolium pratense]|uniref:Uncharacterized protein n=1 Tax=Trifolium pratense TaxID=57577 RepID=A0ACB0KB45_TRIPR|nr:unnamed protein product [Trifolium pratense]
MTQILLFVNTLIIFLSLFLIVTSRSDVPCNSDHDCPTALNRLSKCNDGFCEYRKCGYMNMKGDIVT